MTLLATTEGLRSKYVRILSKSRGSEANDGMP